MAEERYDWRTFNFRDAFPWLNLFRGFEIARDLKKIGLGAIGALLMSIGWLAIAKTFGPQPGKPENSAVAATSDAAARDLAEASRLPWDRPAHPGEVDEFYSPFRTNGWSRDWTGPSRLVLEPLRKLLLPVLLLFHSQGMSAAGLLMLLWTLLVWSVCGGAITRIASVQIARDGQVGLSESVRFVFGRYFSYLVAPVLPFLGVVAIIAFCALGGLLARVPGLNMLMGAFWFLALTAGFVISIALFGLAVGWPLMYSAIGAEATDSFDALSRAYSYVLGRSWRYLFYTAVSLAYGALLMTIVVILGYWLVHLSQYAVVWGGGEANLKAYYAYVPEAGGWRNDFGLPQGSDPPAGTSHWTAMLVGFWVHLVLLAILGFAYSYFWSSATIVYFLLRKDVDETEMEEVFMEEEEEEPFPTIAPTLGPGIEPMTPQAPPPPTTSSILPIVDPPPGR